MGGPTSMSTFALTSVTHAASTASSTNIYRRRFEAALVLAQSCRRVLLPHAHELFRASDDGESLTPRTLTVARFVHDGCLPEGKSSALGCALSPTQRTPDGPENVTCTKLPGHCSDQAD